MIMMTIIIMIIINDNNDYTTGAALEGPGGARPIPAAPLVRARARRRETRRARGSLGGTGSVPEGHV